MKGAVHRLEDVLEATAAAARRGHAGELVVEGDAGGGVGGAGQLVPFEIIAAHRRPAGGAMGAAEGLQAAAEATWRAAAATGAAGTGAEVAGDHAEVIGDGEAFAGEVVEALQQDRKAELQLALEGGGGVGVVEHEQDVDLIAGDAGQVLDVIFCDGRLGKVGPAGGEEADAAGGDQAAHRP